MKKKHWSFTDSLKSLGWELRPEKAGGPGQSPGSSGLAGVQPPLRPAVTERGSRALTQCREPTHSLAASSGMVASSGLRRMHSFSTFTARADLARGERPCETQRFCPGPNTEGFPEGLLVGHPLNKVFQLGPNRAGARGCW